MSKKPQLPGAADFFALPGPVAPAPPLPASAPAPRPAPLPRSPVTLRPPAAPPEPADLAPALTIPEGPTEKVTFYLHPHLLKRLELLKAELLVNQNLKVTRSQVIELLLEQGLEQAEAVTAALLQRAE